MQMHTVRMAHYATAYTGIHNTCFLHTVVNCTVSVMIELHVSNYFVVIIFMLI